jgi:hypothetical protein
MDEFWRLSPAQTVFILNAGAEHKVRKGGVTDMVAMAEATKPGG